MLEELPGAFVSCSHEISPGVGEYARMSTTAGNAALGPLAGRYLSSLEAKLQKAGMKVPVLMMTCAGGVLPTAVLNDRPAFALFSGPAGGVMGSRATGAQAGLDNIVTMDIGGTSFDVGVIVSGKPIMRTEISVAGADIRVHSIDVESIGAGGGSIAYVEFGELRVGPRSAGANPGPACYGRGGTRPTATDADLVLGVLDPDNFIGGRMRLDVEAARHAIDEHVAKPLGMSVIGGGLEHPADSRQPDGGPAPPHDHRARLRSARFHAARQWRRRSFACLGAWRRARPRRLHRAGGRDRRIRLWHRQFRSRFHRRAPGLCAHFAGGRSDAKRSLRMSLLR